MCFTNNCITESVFNKGESELGVCVCAWCGCSQEESLQNSVKERKLANKLCALYVCLFLFKFF